jgi:inner membrane protein
MAPRRVSSVDPKAFIGCRRRAAVLRPGHLGVSLAVYAPLAAALLAAGEPELAVVAGAAMLGLTMLPDVDLDLPFVPHRGPTHSLAFAALVGLTFAGVGSLAAAELGVAAAVGLGSFGFAVGVATVGAHLLADALTPSGVPLFWPVSRRSYSLPLFRADNAPANYGLLALGMLVAAGTLAAVGRLGAFG